MKIKQETLDFLKNIAENNNREWFQANKHLHDSARENVIEFTTGLIKELHRNCKGLVIR